MKKKKKIKYRKWFIVVAAIMAIIGAVGIYYCPLTSKTNLESRLKGLCYMIMIAPLVVIINTDYRCNDNQD